jgi:hypothetical protein
LLPVLYIHHLTFYSNCRPQCSNLMQVEPI